MPYHTEEVTGDEVNTALRVYILATPTQTYHQIKREFQVLTGTDERLLEMGRYTVTKEQADRIRAMAGPHGYAYCKAIIVRIKAS